MRPQRWASALAQAGHEVSVFTASANASNANAGKLIKIFEIAPRRLHPVVRRFRESGYLFDADVVRRTWKKPLVDELRIAHQQGGFDAVVITVPPFSLLEVKWREVLPGAKVLLDFRDPHSLWAISPFATKLHWRRARDREQCAISRSDSIVCTSDTTKEMLTNLHALDRDKIRVIPNGLGAESAAFSQKKNPRKEKLIKIGYGGSFYYSPKQAALLRAKWYQKKPYQWLQFVPHEEDWLYRSPFFFFEALRDANEQAAEIGRIEFHYIGESPVWLPDMAKAARVEQHVFMHGKLSYPEARRFYEGCDYLLLTGAKIPITGDYSIAGKVFEYYATGRPILSFCPPGEMARLVHRVGGGLAIDPDEPEKGSRLAMLLDEALKIPTLVGSVLQSYSPENLAREVVAAVQDCVQKPVQNRR